MNSLTYLTLIISYQCSSKCSHCCIGSGPEHSEWMSPSDAEVYISDAVKNGEINWMTLIGGEALLDPDRTIEIGKIALSYGIPNVEIDTSASWAIDDETTVMVIRKLTEAGLRIGQVSVDAFHQNHVDPEYVHRLFRVAKELGIKLNGSGVLIQPGTPENSFDRETVRLKNWLSQSGFNINLAPAVFQGRAANLSRYYSGERSIPKDTCPGVYFFATEDWRKPGGLEVDVFGSVMLEHGICIGNAKLNRLSDILDSYQADKHPIIRILMDEGPIGLTRLPEAKEFKLREDGYVDKCHLCQDIRTFLQPDFPAILGPDNFYPELD